MNSAFKMNAYYMLQRAREHYTQLHASLLKAYTNVKCRPGACSSFHISAVYPICLCL